MIVGVLFGLAVTALPSRAFATCGDGVLESPAEQCDDGNVSAGDCCAADCQYEPYPTACGAESLCLQALDAACDGAGTCVASLRSCGSRGQAILSDLGPADSEHLEMRTRANVLTPYYVADLGDPSAGTRYAICIFNGVGSAGALGLAYEHDLPTGAGWTPAHDGFVYQRPDVASSPLKNARLRLRLRKEFPAFSSWRARASLSADGEGLALPGPANATQYFAFAPGNEFSQFCLVNEVGMSIGIFSYQGRKNRGFLNNPEHVVWARPLTGD